MMDYAPIWERIVDMTDMALTRPETYRAFRDILGDMRWTIGIKKESFADYTAHGHNLSFFSGCPSERSEAE